MRKLLSILLVFACLVATACADEVKCYIICKPGSYVCVRNTPKKGGKEAGRFDCGDYIYTDGIEKNGFVHLAGAFEGDGWVYKGNVVPDQPVIEKQTMRSSSNSNVICRRCVGGKKVGMLKNGDTVTVYARSEDWAVTDKGYIMIRFLEVDE